MSLKTKMLVVGGTVFAFLALIFFLGSHVVAGSIAGRLENDSIRENLERALQAIEREMAELDKLAADWATWDDTYDFVEDGNQIYIKKNLGDNVFQILRLNYIIFLNTKEEQIYARGYDLETGNEIPIPLEVILPATNKTDSLKGLAVTLYGPVLLAARPVLKSDGSGPPRGTLIFGRILKNKNLTELSAIIGLPLALHPSEAIDLRSLQFIGFLYNGEPFYTEVISQEESAGFTTIRDLQGEAALILEVNSRRPAFQALHSAVLTFGLFLTLAAILGCLLIFFWLDRTVLSRLARLTAAVTSTGHNISSAPRVSVLEGKDELALLSTEIRQMLERLENYQREVSEQERKYRALVENAAEAIIVVQEGRITFLNQAAVKHTGYQVEDLLSQPFLDFIYSQDKKSVLHHYRILLEQKRPLYAYPFRILAKDGSVRWVETNSTTIEWEGRSATLHFLTDITPRKILEEELQRLMAEKSLILDSLTELVLFLDRDLHIIWANRAASQSLAKVPEELFGAKCHEIRHHRSVPCPNCPVVPAMETAQVRTGEVISPDGRIWSIIASPVKDKQGEIIGAVEAALDITERKLYEEQLKFLSLHDSLTGLYNRTFFQEELQRLSRSRDYPVTILVADLDGLKLVNDILGHAQGDELLKACASVLKLALRRSDILARIGGDEFAAILPRTSRRAVENIVRRIHFFIERYNREHPQLPIYLSIGCATCPGEAKSLEEAFTKADDLMYRHKLICRGTARSKIVEALLVALQERDYITSGHTQRLKEICLKMADELGLSPRRRSILTLLAEVHDLGKVAIPDSILSKPGPLNDEEQQIMRQHSEKGYRIALCSPELAGIADLILKHHERWDGTGYPLGLKGEEIPLECRILAIAEAFDAMTSERPYRKKPWSQKQALDELKMCAGKQFDPQLVEVFVSLFSGTCNVPTVRREGTTL